LHQFLLLPQETTIFNLPTAQRAETKQSKPVIYNGSKFIWLLLQWKFVWFAVTSSFEHRHKEM